MGIKQLKFDQNEEDIVFEAAQHSGEAIPIFTLDGLFALLIIDDDGELHVVPRENPCNTR